MSLSRDEAREVAAVAIAFTIVLRWIAGVFQAIDELTGQFTLRSVLGRFTAPVGATMGMLTLALALLIVLSPAGSIEKRTFKFAEWLGAACAVFGVLSVLNSLVFGFGSIIGRVWFAALNGFAAVILGAAAWWILSSFDAERSG